MWIEFSELNIKLLILIIFPVFMQIQNFTRNAYIEKDNSSFKAFRYFSSYIFSGIFLIIFKIRNRSSSSKKTQSKINEEKEEYLIDEIIKKDKRKKIIIKILFMGLLCGIGMFCQFYKKLFDNEKYRNAKQSIEIFFFIISFTSLSCLILKQKLYKHHFVSLSIMSIILIILFILSIYIMELIFQSALYYLGYSFLFSLYDVMQKKYMNLYYSTPYVMMLIIGLINAILLFIIDLIIYYINPDNVGVIIGLNENVNSAGKVFLFILDLIIQCIWNLGFWLTIYYFSPCHAFISEFISDIFYLIRNSIEKKDEFYSTRNAIIFSISYFIIFFFVLMFNEVIILNFFGLDYNTKKRIKARERTESNIMDIISLKGLTKDEEGEDD